jgi:CxxC-x17-CxxC domain-containing protein
MGDFRSFEQDRDERPSRSRFGGRESFGGRGRNFTSRGGGYGGGRDRRSMPACDAVCAKCGKDCKVPFKPTGDKPVYCSECFGATGGGRDNLRPIERSAPSMNSTSSGITQEQFRELNKKLDKILGILNSLEMVEDEEGDEDEAESETPTEQKADNFESADDKE